MPVGGWDTAPPCVQSGIPGEPYLNVYKPYESCSDFFTYGPGSTFGTFSDGVATSYWILTGLGFAVSIFFLVWWVVLENQKLIRQTDYLLKEGVAKTVQRELSGDSS